MNQIARFRVNSTLTGGQITSTQAAIDNNKNSFETGGNLTTSDLHNSASFEAQSVSVGTSGGNVAPGGVGLGSDKGSASRPVSAARTGDAETGIGQIFNKEQAQQEVATQVAITQEFGKQASKAVGDYAGSQKATLSQQANAETDPDKKAQLQAEAAKWDEGGVYRVAMHTVVGGLALARVLMGFSAYATQSATLDFRAFTNDPLGWRKAKKSYQSDKAPKESSIEKPLDKPGTPKPKG